MKFTRQLLFLASCMLLLTACPTKKPKDGLKLLKENNYDFSDFKKIYHQGLRAQVPSYFTQEYGKSYMLKDDGLSLFNPETSIYISIERFTRDEAADIRFVFEEGTALVEAVHTHYADLRAHSLDKPKISIVQDNSRKTPLKGYYQVIRGKRTAYDYVEMVYMFSTVEKYVSGEKNYYVIQLIAPDNLAQYLSDDFRRMIKALK